MPYLTLNGAALHYELAGSGAPAFVFVHGGCCSLQDWRPQLDALQSEFRVLAMDLRGHGRSGVGEGVLDIAQWAADLNALLDALALGPAVLTGHSLGARVAAEAAWRRRDQIAALVLLDGSRTVGGFAATAPPPQPSALADAPSLAQILDRTVGPYAAPEIRRSIIETMVAAPSAVMQAAVQALADWDRTRADVVYGGLAEGVPVLAIQSTYHDRFTPRRSLADAAESTPYLDFLRSVRPGVEVRALPHTGHFSMLERPDLVTTLIRDFGLTTWRAGAFEAATLAMQKPG